MKRVCIFCGSSVGACPSYIESARAIARLVAARRVGIVYGGGNVGLMGVVADAALEAGGEVIGVIPDGLVARELGGIAGIFLAIPALAVLSVAHRHWLEHKGSEGLVADLLKPPLE